MISRSNQHLELVAPCAEYAESFCAHAQEFPDRGEKLVPFTLSFAAEPLEALLGKLASCARGEGIPAGFVAHSTYWLVDGGKVVGVSNIRHRLTDALRREGGNIGYGIRPSCRGQGFAHALLRRTLAKAKLLGLDEVWLTCGKTNTASIRTIMRNGGIFVSEEYLERRGEIVQRYRIGLSNGSNAL